jgi:hypothetical protein
MRRKKKYNTAHEICVMQRRYEVMAVFPPYALIVM